MPNSPRPPTHLHDKQDSRRCAAWPAAVPQYQEGAVDERVRSSGATAAVVRPCPSLPGEAGEVGRVGSGDGSGNGAQRIVIGKEGSHGGLAHCRKLARRR